MEPPSLLEIHQSVLLDEAVTMLRVVPGGVYVDGTLGLGGHSREILERSSPDGRVIGFEWDQAAIELASRKLQEYGERLKILGRNFTELVEGLADCGLETVDGIVADFGLSSLQLDAGKRGFSFQKDEMLDMRMDRRAESTAAAILETASEQELADIFYYFGEERQARRIASRIVECRKTEPITTTRALAELVYQAVPRKFHPPRIHVATRVFQALRIAVNDELKNIAGLLDRAPECLAAGGRLCVISFHSLEDRIVKRKLAADDRLAVRTKKPIFPGQAEIEVNPRARSARLRVAERLAGQC